MVQTTRYCIELYVELYDMFDHIHMLMFAYFSIKEPQMLEELNMLY